MWFLDSSSCLNVFSRSAPTSCPWRFTALPATKTESTFDVSEKTTMVPSRIDHRGRVDRVDVQQDDVRLLARRERADPVLEHDRARSVDRRELEHVPVRELRRECDVRRVGELEDPVVGERRPHLGEHLARHARDHVDAERRAGRRERASSPSGAARDPSASRRTGAIDALPPDSAIQSSSSSVRSVMWM